MVEGGCEHPGFARAAIAASGRLEEIGSTLTCRGLRSSESGNAGTAKCDCRKADIDEVPLPGAACRVELFSKRQVLKTIGRIEGMPWCPCIKGWHCLKRRSTNAHGGYDRFWVTLKTLCTRCYFQAGYIAATYSYHAMALLTPFLPTLPLGATKTRRVLMLIVVCRPGIVPE